MGPLEITLITFLIIYVIAIPFLKKYLIYQYISLVISAFLIGYLFDNIVTVEGIDRNGLILIILLIGGLIFNSVRFFRRNLVK
ncbi:MAG: hypothetical protein C0595_12555 [Marinilabiliales bacterium]|nr:MAG: hypothetical protein C0595_12555 [Marinilabiliales bacterium]